MLKDLDPENDDTTTDDADDNNADDSTTDDKSQQSDDKKASEKIDWEARYKGLQRASEKKRNELETKLTKAETDLETTTTDLEDVKSDTGSLESKRTEAEKAKEDLENEVTDLTGQRDKLEKQINQQNIVMSEFPQLAPLAKFIPVGEDEKAFRESAADFNTALEQYVEKGVDKSLQGSSATFEQGDDDTLSADETALDAAWTTIYKHGGDPEHQDEVDKANALIREKQPESDI